MREFRDCARGAFRKFHFVRCWSASAVAPRRPNGPPRSEDRSDASDEAVALEQTRMELARCLDEASELPGIETNEYRWLRSRLAEKTFSILFVGQSRHGTTGAINALLGERVLPPPIAATRTAVTIVRFGPTRRARVELSDRRTATIAPRLDNEPARHVARVRRILVDQPSAWLAGGIQLIETPAVSLPYEYNTHAAHRYLPSVDAVVFVSLAARPVSRAASEFLTSLRPYSEKIFCLVDESGIPRLDRERTRLADAKREIALAIGSAVPIFAVSAERSLASRLHHETALSADAPFVAFEQELQRFLGTRRRETWIESVAENLLRILSHARAKLSLELATLTASVDELEGRAMALELAKTRLLDVQRRARETLRADVGALLQEEIEPALECFADQQRQRMHAAMNRGPAPDERRRSDARAAFAGWFMREEGTISRAFDSLCARFWSDVQTAIDELVQEAGELFGFHGGNAAAAAPRVTASAFRYRFWRRPTALRLRWILCDAAFPRVIFENRMTCRAGTSVFRQIEAHTWRIGKDFEWRLNRSVEDVRCDVAARVSAAAAGLQAAIEGALALRQDAPEQIAVHRERLIGSRTALVRLEARVRAIVSGGRPGSHSSGTGR